MNRLKPLSIENLEHRNLMAVDLTVGPALDSGLFAASLDLAHNEEHDIRTDSPSVLANVANVSSVAGMVPTGNQSLLSNNIADAQLQHLNAAALQDRSLAFASLVGLHNIRECLVATRL